MQISISSLQTHNVNRCGRSRHLARKLSLRRKRSSPNVFEMAATETITSIILIKLIRVSLGTVRHPRRFKIVIIVFFQAEDGIRDVAVTGVQTCALPISGRAGRVPGTRELIISNTPFIVAYAIEKTDIVVLAVYHGAQHWPEGF